MVFSAEDLLKVVDIFDRHPPKGRKRREYEIWRDAAIQYANVRPARRAYDKLDRLRSALSDARTYRTPYDPEPPLVDITRSS